MSLIQTPLLVTIENLGCNRNATMNAILLASCLLATTHGALILEHQYAKFRELPPYNIYKDPLRRNLIKKEFPVQPRSCHYYKILRSVGCENGPLLRSVICVECTGICADRDNHFSKVLNRCRGRWTRIGKQEKCSCRLITGNYVFV